MKIKREPCDYVVKMNLESSVMANNNNCRSNYGAEMSDHENSSKNFIKREHGNRDDDSYSRNTQISHEDDECLEPNNSIDKVPQNILIKQELSENSNYDELLSEDDNGSNVTVNPEINSTKWHYWYGKKYPNITDNSHDRINSIQNFTASDFVTNGTIESILPSSIKRESSVSDNFEIPLEVQIIEEKQMSKKSNDKNKTFSCELCDFTCKQALVLLNHRIVHTGETPFQCEVCKLKFKRFGQLSRHRLIHLEKTLACDDCPLKFKLQKHLNKHKMLHSGVKPFVCETCNYECFKSFDLKRHKNIHKAENPFACDECSFTCKHASSLKRHKMVHTDDRPYVCDICNYRCKQLAILTVHRMIHSEIKSHVCDVCNYKCAHSDTLRRHKLTHNEKCFVCDVCDYRCNRVSNLKSHKLIHSDYKPYACDVCSFRSKHLSNLNRHRAYHDIEKSTVSSNSLVQ